MKKSANEIEDLKKDWLMIGGWDIENTEGFEDHKEELLIYRGKIELLDKQNRLEDLLKKAYKLNISVEDVELSESLEYRIKDRKKQAKKLLIHYFGLCFEGDLKSDHRAEIESVIDLLFDACTARAEQLIIEYKGKQ